MIFETMRACRGGRRGVHLELRCPLANRGWCRDSEKSVPSRAASVEKARSRFGLSIFLEISYSRFGGTIKGPRMKVKILGLPWWHSG